MSQYLKIQEKWNCHCPVSLERRAWGKDKSDNTAVSKVKPSPAQHGWGERSEVMVGVKQQECMARLGTASWHAASRRTSLARTLLATDQLWRVTMSNRLWLWAPKGRRKEEGAGTYLRSSLIFELPQCLSCKESAWNAGSTSSTPGLGRSSRGRHGSWHQFSWLKDPMDRGAWSAIVAKSWMWPSTHALIFASHK